MLFISLCRYGDVDKRPQKKIIVSLRARVVFKNFRVVSLSWVQGLTHVRDWSPKGQPSSMQIVNFTLIIEMQII